MENHKSFLFVILLIISALKANAQTQTMTLNERTSPLTYIYKITGSEAKTLVAKTPEKIEQQYFHTLIDTCLTSKKNQKILPAGHYLYAYTDRNQQIADYVFVPSFDVKVLNNNTDLCLQIYDLQGNIIKNANVKIKSKALKFDAKTNCYIHRKSNKKGLLSVTCDGFTAYYQLEKGRIKSTVSMTVRGAIWSVGNFFNRTWDKILCLLDEDWNCDDSDWKFTNKHSGYLVFNKPKYLPDDTVKCKAFIVNKKTGKPLNKSVIFRFYNGNKYLNMDTIHPYSSGAYEYNFCLHDSLNMKLDKQYQVYLTETNDKHRTYISKSFRYEDYELSKLKLNLRLPKQEHFHNHSLSIFAKATDENDLQLMDARVKIFVKPAGNHCFFDSLTFIPDTLLTVEKDLLPQGETTVEIVDSLFPKANFDYEIQFTLLTSDNRSLTKTEKAHYVYSQKGFELALENDSVECVYRENGIRKEQNVQIFGEDGFKKRTLLFEGLTPCKLALNSYYSNYIAQSGSLKNSLSITNEAPLLQCFSERTCDSVFINIQNPRNLIFAYNIYKKNSEKMCGSGISLNYRAKERSKQNYFVSLRYLWGGEAKTATYRVPFFDKKLNIQVEQPAMAFPGQTINTEITVTDAKGKTVEGVDLTAFALTGKFNYQLPSLPDFTAKRPDKKLINNFSIREINQTRIAEQLDYNYWNALAQLDSLEFYKFLYPPKDSVYRFEYATADSITQFAPFVVDENGNLQTIHVIYVDGRPVYFSWANNEQPYSFRINSGLHHIRLRLQDREIVLTKFPVLKGKKLIISMQRDIYTSQNHWQTAGKKKLSRHEQEILSNYLFPYRKNFGNALAYVHNGNNIQLLSGQNTHFGRYYFAGPVNGKIQFRQVGDYSLDFVHEPFFQYDFAPEILKMREIDKKYYPVKLSSRSKINSDNLNDTALTINNIESLWRKRQKQRRQQLRAKDLFPYPTRTETDFGTLHLDIVNKYRNETGNYLNLLLFCLDETKFLRIYPNSISNMYQLQEAYYKLMLLFDDEQYCILDSVFVKKNGVNYLKFNVPDKLIRDTFSINIDREIRQNLQNKSKESFTTNYAENQLIEKIYDNYNTKFTYNGDGYTVSGLVFEKSSGEPVIGASVIVKGTTYGAITDINGKYSLKVPSDKHILVVHLLGFISNELDLNTSLSTAIALEEDITTLNEVVVVGCSATQKKMNLTGYVTTVNMGISNALQGMVAGISANKVSGNLGDSQRIFIRDIASIYESQSPLNGIDNFSLPDAMQPGSTKPDFDPTFLEAALQAGSIRTNFSDYAYWQPRLTTDKNGKAQFTTTLPDDIVFS